MTPLDAFGARRRQLLTGSGAIALGGLLGTPALWAQTGAVTYEPERGQSGKDVIWIPTPDTLVNRMLRMAQVTPKDYVIDLGSGDGKIVIAAAKAGARGLGIEYNPELVTLARQRAQAAGVAEHARFEKADIFESDFSRASIVTLYLLPRLNLRLRHRLLALTPGTRVVSHSFDMGDWRPDEVTNAGGATAFLWLVPANFGGEWALRFPLADGAEARGLLEVDQRFQQIGGAGPGGLDGRFGDLFRRARNVGGFAGGVAGAGDGAGDEDVSVHR